jgi:hypothetical protein
MGLCRHTGTDTTTARALRGTATNSNTYLATATATTTVKDAGVHADEDTFKEEEKGVEGAKEKKKNNNEKNKEKENENEKNDETNDEKNNEKGRDNGKEENGKGNEESQNGVYFYSLTSWNEPNHAADGEFAETLCNKSTVFFLPIISSYHNAFIYPRIVDENVLGD